MNLVERVKGILLQPNSEWSAIAREPGNAGYLFPNYVAILAAVVTRKPQKRTGLRAGRFEP